jgi:hypothetical protein
MRSVKTPSYAHSAYPSAWLAGLCGFLYSVSFVLVSRAAPNLGQGLSGFFLLAGGILGASALLGLYLRLAPAGGGYAMWALVFGLGGALSATLHGGYDLANAVHSPGQTTNLPSEVDPRGLGTFGLAGAAVLAFAYVMSHDDLFPRNLVYLGYVSGALLVLIYLARLIILTPSNPLVLGPAAVEGFVINPAWYIWLGFALRRAL